MVYIPATKKYNGKTYTQLGGDPLSKVAADKEAAQLKAEGYSVRRVGVKVGSARKFYLFIRPV